MNVYVWQYVAQCSNNYHSQGGVVVFARTEERARDLANARDGCAIQPDEAPDRVAGCPLETEEGVFIFTDAGCC